MKYLILIDSCQGPGHVQAYGLISNRQNIIVFLHYSIKYQDYADGFYKAQVCYGNHRLLRKLNFKEIKSFISKQLDEVFCSSSMTSSAKFQLLIPKPS